MFLNEKKMQVAVKLLLVLAFIFSPKLCFILVSERRLLITLIDLFEIILSNKVTRKKMSE